MEPWRGDRRAIKVRRVRAGAPLLGRVPGPRSITRLRAAGEAGVHGSGRVACGLLAACVVVLGVAWWLPAVAGRVRRWRRWVCG